MLFPHFPADIAKFLQRGVLKPFALPVKMLVDLHGRLLHHGVGFLGTADKDEIIAARQPGMAVIVIEGNAEERGRSGGGLGGFHGPEL